MKYKVAKKIANTTAVYFNFKKFVKKNTFTKFLCKQFLAIFNQKKKFFFFQQLFILSSIFRQNQIAAYVPNKKKQEEKKKKSADVT